MKKLFVFIERIAGEIDDSGWEMLTAARSFGGECRVGAICLGEGVDRLGEQLAQRFDDVFLFDDERLALPDGDLYAAVLAPLLKREKPFLTLFAHTNNGMDLAPSLSIRIGVPLIADCVSMDLSGESLHAVRTVYGGKVHARVTVAPSENGTMVTVRPGAFMADGALGTAGEIHREKVPAEIAVGRRTLETITPEAGEVDITQAEKLVAAGRGIDDEDNMEIIESLAEALGAEVACSRPLVDKGWLPKSRQVGTSGLTVKPKVYIAVGISGSFQHMGGIKGGPFLVAINKDRRAPIFNVADVGIVGDLFDIVPLLEEKIREAKG